MQKILFNKENALQIAVQAADVCNLFNQLSDYQLSKIELLNAFAKVFGYRSGWAEFISVNKSTRFYVNFSMSVCSHMRAIIENLLEFLPPYVEREQLLVAVSFSELNVKNIGNYFKYNSSRDSDLEKYVLWYTENSDTPLKHLAYSATAALFERQAIRLDHFEILWPELHKYLNQNIKLSQNWVLLFEKPIWWNYRDQFDAKFQSTKVGQWEIYFNNTKESERICYESIYFDGHGGFLEHMATICSEGLSGCPAIENFGADMDDVDYVQACLENWKTLNHIKDIKFSLKNEHLSKLDCSSFSQLEKYLKEHNNSFDLITSNVEKMDFTGASLAYEPRYSHNSFGKKTVYQEPWIIQSDIDKFIDVNRSVDKYIKKFNRLQLLAIGSFIEAYRREMYHPIFRKK